MCTHLIRHSFLTSEVKLLYWFSTGGLLVLVVGDGGVFENKPVLFVCPQCQSFGPDVGQKNKNNKYHNKLLHLPEIEFIDLSD